MGEGHYQEQMGLCDNVGIEDRPTALDKPAGYWQTAGGRVLAIRDMTFSHLENAIGYLDRHGLGLHPKCLELVAERDSRRSHPMKDNKCTACSFESKEGAPIFASSPYLTALAQVSVIGDVKRVAGWMCEEHRADLEAVVSTLKQVPVEDWPHP